MVVCGELKERRVDGTGEMDWRDLKYTNNFTWKH